jgi:hypothetical protein
MAMVKVDFSVQPTGVVKGYWIAVGEQDVLLAGGQGSIRLDDTMEQALLWWFIGNSGAALAVVGKVGSRTVVEVKQSVIPDGKHEGAGIKRFAL